MRIAIMGTRGVPAAYGGFETFAERLGARLVERGHGVTVYGRSHTVPDGLREHLGMRLRVLPTIRHKYLDTVAHTALSVVDGLPRRFDVVLICNNANAPFALVPRLGGAKVVLNVDGLEAQPLRDVAAGFARAQLLRRSRASDRSGGRRGELGRHTRRLTRRQTYVIE